MASQLDLDQGGTSRSWVNTYLGPSVGWLRVPQQGVLSITVAGTYIIDPSISLVAVGAVPSTIVLPTAANPVVGPQALPGLFADNPITIVDVSGQAFANNITIQSTGSTIMGLASIKISVNYGGYTLSPNSAQNTWISISP